MSIVQNRIDAVEAAKMAVIGHCMCAKFEETSYNVMAYYPEGYNLGGCRVAIGEGGKAKALETLAAKMEQHWQESMWWK